MQLPIYLDNIATTPVDPLVLETMLPFFTQVYGNASSQQHSFGIEAANAVEIAREQVANIIGSEPKEIVFTSGATESNNLAIQGLAYRHREHGGHIVTEKSEHKAVLAPCNELERQGFNITYLDVDQYGWLNPEDVDHILTEDTILVSVMVANNEVGTIQSISEIGKFCRDRGILFHTDAAQAFGKIPIDVEKMNIDLMSFSAHKIYGPKGVGGLFIRNGNPRIRLRPLLYGGGQENGLRSGTLPVPNIVGFGKACELARLQMETETVRLRDLRDRLFHRISEKLIDVQVNGHPTERLPGLLNLSIPGVDAESLIYTLKDVAISQGSSCTSGSLEPSHVLKAIGLSDERAQESIRFGIGRFNTPEEIDWVGDHVVKAVSNLRALAAS